MEIKQIVREMLAAGMPESEILSNLSDLGVPETQKVLAEAKAAAGQKAAARPAAPEVAAKARSSLFSEEPTAQAPSAKPSLFDEPAGPDISGSVLSSPSLDPGQKLDELIALSRSLLELNKKILDSNREILLRLQK